MDWDFERRAVRIPTTGCLIWLGARTGSGYAAVRTDTKSAEPVHRLVWIREYGPIPKGLEVCHTCDTPPCIEIDHLFLGTHKVNMADMARKGRGRAKLDRGSKLTTDDVRAIRRDRRLHREIAADYGIARAFVTMIKNRKKWRHVP